MLVLADNQRNKGHKELHLLTNHHNTNFTSGESKHKFLHPVTQRSVVLYTGVALTTTAAHPGTNSHSSHRSYQPGQSQKRRQPDHREKQSAVGQNFEAGYSTRDLGDRELLDTLSRMMDS